MQDVQVLTDNFVKACKELHDHQINFYYFVRNGGTDFEGCFHPNIRDNKHIGAYFAAREALEAATQERHTVLPDLVGDK